MKSKLNGKGVLGIIVARKGSVRVPRKSIKLLAGKPLVVWSFEEAKKSKTLDRIIVSTDDEEVKRLAEECGIEVPFFPRPSEISTDCDSGAVLAQAVKFMEEERDHHPSSVVLLQPTSPFRKAEDIDAAVVMFQYGMFDTVVSVVKVKEHPAWTFRLRKDGSLESYLGFPMKHLSGLIAQDLPELFLPNGALYILKKELALEGRVYGENIGGYLMPPERSIDLETGDDFLIAEAILEKLKTEETPKSQRQLSADINSGNLYEMNGKNIKRLGAL